MDGNSFTSVNQKLFGVTVTTTEPYPIQRAVIKPGTYQPGVATYYIIDIFPEHSIKVGGGLLITIPPQISKMGTSEIQINATLSSVKIDNEKLYTKYQPSARTIVIENIIQALEFVPSPENKISVKISGLNTPYTDQPTDSFRVSTFNMINGDYFFIDTVRDGLFIKSQCSYPCNTCLIDKPTVCTSCFET